MLFYQLSDYPTRQSVRKMFGRLRVYIVRTGGGWLAFPTESAARRWRKVAGK